MIKDKYDVYVLKQFDNKIEKEFKVIPLSHITTYPKYEIPEDIFEDWIIKNKLDAVVFNEYNQWTTNKNPLISVAKKHNVKVYGYLVWEKYSKNEDYEDYDRIWCPTKSFCRFMRTHRFRKFSYIPFALDLKQYNIKTEKNSDKFRFFHPAGFGGVHNRKNTEAVIRAFIKLNDENTELVITSQKDIEIKNKPDNIILINKNLSREDLLKEFGKADCVVMPSKWDTIGISVLESLAMGKPVVVTNVPPLNEFIKDGLNGFTCKVSFENYPDISVMAAIADINSLKNKMSILSSNREICSLLSKNSKLLAEREYSIEKNKHYLLDFLDKELNKNEIISDKQ